MTQQPAPTSSIYPPQKPEIVDRALREIVTGQRDEERNPILRRALREDERTALRDRFAALEKFAAPGRRSEKKFVISGMLSGFGGASVGDVEDAHALADQYVQTCAELPLWSVMMACSRFAAGQVRPEEIGQKRIDFNFRPTTAQLYVVAAGLAKPVLEERYRIGAALRGIVVLDRPAMSDEQLEDNRRAVAQSLERFGRGREEVEAGEAALREMRLRRRGEDAARQNEERIIAEYVARGLDPPERRPGGILVSLPTLLKLGWRIEEITIAHATGNEYRHVLVAPLAPPPSVRLREQTVL